MKSQNLRDKRIGDKSKQPIWTIVLICAVFLFVFFSLLLAFSLRWLLSQWASLTIEEILIQVATSVGGTAKERVISYAKHCLIPASGLTAAAMIAAFYFKKVNKKTGSAVLAIQVIVSAVILLITGIVAWKELKFEELNTTEYSELVDGEYIATETAEISFREKKNLVYIYLESMETTFSDAENGGAFPYNCIPELCELAKDNEDFSGPETKLNGGLVLPGTGWTIAAMVAHTSGIPMKIGSNNMSRLKEFFPKMTNLGDILNENGYTQELLIGSDADFGGRRTLFSQHGDYNIADYNYAKENGWIAEDYNVWWGYEDEKLFGFAKSELLRLAGEDEPFNLTILTADTHFPDGYFCELCKDEFPDNPYADVMACSNRQVSEFVHWIQEQEFYEDTAIVLMGDHITMDEDFCDNVPDSYERCVYTAYINAAVEPVLKERRVYSTFDAFPTTLAAIGAEIEGNRLGLGTNLFSDTPTLCEKYGVEVMDEELRKNSHVIDSLQQDSVYDEIRETGDQFIKPCTAYLENKKCLYSRFDFSALKEWDINKPDKLSLQLKDTKKDRTLTELSISSDGNITHGFQSTSEDDAKDRLCLQVKKKNGKLLDEWYFDAAEVNIPSGIWEMHIDNLFLRNYIVSLESMKKDDEIRAFHDAANDFELSAVFSLDYEKAGEVLQFTTTINKWFMCSLETFLSEIDNSDYAVFISVSDEATRSLSDEAKDLLHDLGLQEDLNDKFRYSYCALICGGEVQIEQLCEEKLKYSGELPDGTKYVLTSGGYTAGSESHIILNDIECSSGMRGLNIVIYNLSTGTIEVKRNFDTHLTMDEIKAQ